MSSLIILDDDAISSLLAPAPTFTGIPQEGPLRWYDREMRCATKRCNSPTYCKVEGIPKCTIHALTKLNEMLVEKGGVT